MHFDHEILIAESDVTTLKILKEILIQEGFIVHFAGNGRLGHELALKNRPDLILSEIELPDQNGRKFMKRIHDIPELGETPFIFLTSSPDPENKIAVLEAGAEDCITKPFNETELITRIKVVLKRCNKAGICALNKEDGIKGDLKDINLIDLIQLFDMGHKTAVIQVEGRERRGRIYFEDGKPVHAVSGRHFGKEALHTLLSIREGTFLIHLQITSKIRTLHDTPTNLIMEAMYRFDQEGTPYPPVSRKERPESPEDQLLYSDGIKELFEKGVIEEKRKS